MKKSRCVDVIGRLQKIQRVLEFVGNSSVIIFGIIFLIVYIWEICSPGTVPLSLLCGVIVSIVVPYILATAYFLTKGIIKYMAKTNK